MNLRDGIMEIVGVFRAAYQETGRFLAEDVREGEGVRQVPDARVEPCTGWTPGVDDAADNGRARG